MVLHQIDTTTQKIFQILNCRNVVVELCRHGDEQIYITTLAMLIPGYRTKKPHRGDTKALLQLGGMASDSLDVFASGSHRQTFRYSPQIYE